MVNRKWFGHLLATLPARLAWPKSYLALVGVLCASCANGLNFSNSPYEPVTIPQSRRAPSSTFSYDIPSDEKDLKLSDLRKILQAKQFSKIEDLLAYLAANYNEYLSHHTFSYASRSLHESSFDNPRAIVYGNSGGLVISFNGAPLQNGYAHLEIMHFNDSIKEFEFYDIRFNEKADKNRPSFEFSENGGVNQECSQCHAGNRPIFDPYPLWPGFYGSNDDHPFAKNFRDQSLNYWSLKDNGFEMAHLQKFLTGNAQKGRYRYLPSRTNSPFDSEPHPNGDLSTNLHLRNLTRIKRLLGAAGGDGELRYLLAYGAYCESVIPASSKWAKLASNFQKCNDDDMLKALSGNLRRQAELTHVDWHALLTEYQRTSSRATASQDLSHIVGVDDFFTKLVLLNRPIQRYGGNRFGRLFPPKTILPLYFALLKKYVPEANSENWAISMLEAGNAFSSGTGDDIEDLRSIVWEFLVNSKVVADYAIANELNSRDLSPPELTRVCSLLYDRIPSRFKDREQSSE